MRRGARPDVVPIVQETGREGMPMAAVSGVGGKGGALRWNCGQSIPLRVALSRGFAPGSPPVPPLPAQSSARRTAGGRTVAPCGGCLHAAWRKPWVSQRAPAFGSAAAVPICWARAAPWPKMGSGLSGKRDNGALTTSQSGDILHKRKGWQLDHARRVRGRGPAVRVSW